MRRPARRIGTLGDVLVLGALAAYAIPFFWQLLTSFKPEAELLRVPPLLPSRLTLAHYRVVIGMFWYFPSASHQDGKAVHTVADYGIAPDGFPTVVDGVCASTTG